MSKMFGYDVAELENDDPLLDKVMYCFDLMCELGLDIYEYTGAVPTFRSDSIFHTCRISLCFLFGIERFSWNNLP